MILGSTLLLPPRGDQSLTGVFAQILLERMAATDVRIGVAQVYASFSRCRNRFPIAKGVYHGPAEDLHAQGSTRLSIFQSIFAPILDF
ncbi:MAG: hypothetical protein ACYCOU_16090 [Sulfobacillus sp.]